MGSKLQYPILSNSNKATIEDWEHAGEGPVVDASKSKCASDLICLHLNTQQRRHFCWPICVNPSTIRWMDKNNYCEFVAYWLVEREIDEMQEICAYDVIYSLFIIKRGGSITLMALASNIDQNEQSLHVVEKLVNFVYRIQRVVSSAKLS